MSRGGAASRGLVSRGGAGSGARRAAAVPLGAALPRADVFKLLFLAISEFVSRDLRRGCGGRWSRLPSSSATSRGAGARRRLVHTTPVSPHSRRSMQSTTTYYDGSGALSRSSMDSPSQSSLPSLCPCLPSSCRPCRPWRRSVVYAVQRRAPEAGGMARALGRGRDLVGLRAAVVVVRTCADERGSWRTQLLQPARR